MVFCNEENGYANFEEATVTILILVDGFLQYDGVMVRITSWNVTILILVDGFLQFVEEKVIR